MRNIGIARKVDKLGRIVLPKEFRDFFKIDTGTRLEMVATDSGILIRFPEFEVKKIGE